MTEHSLPVAPRGSENKQRQTVYMPQTEEKESNQSLFLRGNQSARQNT